MQTLMIENDLTIYNALSQKQLLLKFLESGQELEINLSQVAEMDGAGLQLLILLKREAAASGKTLRFVMHSKPVLDILELTKLTANFGDQVVLAGA
jgi:anti-anti-sigma factor